MTRGLAAIVSLAVVVGGCGGGGSRQRAGELGATGAWARTTPGGADTGVVYLTVRSPVDDAVVGVSVPPEVAGAVTLHRTVTEGGSHAGHHGGGAGGAVVAMEDVEQFELTASEPLVFEPGGNHVMLTDLDGPLRAGDEFTLTLELASGATLVVDVVVADNPPGE